MPELDQNSNAGIWLKELRGCLDSSAHFDRGATVYQAVDTLEAMLADLAAEAERLANELDDAVRRADAADGVVRGARSLWSSWAFCAPEALGRMAAYKIGGPLRELDALNERTGSPTSGGEQR